MTNISEDRKVVLESVREVPYETTLVLSDAEQDQSIKNRYWFNLPSQWVNQSNKDPIIGIRSIYCTKTIRFIRYSYKIELINFGAQAESIDTIEGIMNLWLDGTDTIRPITETFNRYWLTDGTRYHTCSDDEHKWSDWEIQSYYGYDRETHTTHLYFGRGILEDPYYSLVDDNTTTLLPYQVSITPLSDDAKVLFGTDSTLVAEWSVTKPCRVEIPIWSRYQCLVKSSLAESDKNNILGHTRNDPYTPIKYYRLNHDIKKFWIELYETRFHDCPVVFPSDGRDDLIIEAIVCLSSQGMI